MKKKIIILSISILVGVFGFNFLSSFKTYNIRGEIPLIEKDQLIVNSDLIIRGVVKDILPSKWSNPGFKRGNNIRNILQTDICVDVSEVFKGDIENADNVIVRINKGSTVTTKMESEGYPDFKKKEEVILFLSKDDSDVAKPEEDYYVLTGMCQGKYYLDIVLNNEKQFKTSFEQSNDTIDLTNFKQEVKNNLESEKLNPKVK